MEEGLPSKELIALNEYYASKVYKKNKPRKKLAKYIMHKNLFFTSRCFMLYHFVQNLIFWLLVIIFPAISVTGCVTGFLWMSHVAMGLFCFLSFVFDCVFAGQYFERESMKYELKAYQNGVVDRSAKCRHMCLIWFECIFEMAMTQVAMFDIYTDIAFAAVAHNEGLSPYW